MKNVKCKNIVNKKGTDRECNRHLLKFVNDDQIHVPCPICGHHAIIMIEDGKLVVVHVNKQSEEQICQKMM
jgi:hypothetical protein